MKVDPTPEQIAAFQTAWEEADRRGETGQRTKAGLTAVLSLPGPYRNMSYRCSESGHIFGKFFPKSKTEKARTCVIPGCTETEIRKVT